VNAALLTGLSSPYGIAVSGTNLSIATHLGGTVDKYDATTQKLLASISGLNSPAGVAVSSSRLFVAEQGAGKIDEYAATTLKLVKAGRVTGLGGGPYGIAVSGADLFVVNNGSGTIGEYDAATEAAVNPALITGLSSPRFLAIAAVVIPEPSTLALLGAGLAGLAFRRYRRIG